MYSSGVRNDARGDGMILLQSKRVEEEKVVACSSSYMSGAAFDVHNMSICTTG